MASKKIQTPEQMWDMFVDYQTDVKTDPTIKIDYVGKDATPVNRYIEKPLTYEDFELYVANIDGMPWTLDHYFANTGKAYENFLSVCSRIRKAIRADQIRGGLQGHFNASITQRLNGLVERSEVKQVVEQPLFGDDVTEL